MCVVMVMGQSCASNLADSVDRNTPAEVPDYCRQPPSLKGISRTLALAHRLSYTSFAPPGCVPIQIGHHHLAHLLDPLHMLPSVAVLIDFMAGPIWCEGEVTKRRCWKRGSAVTGDVTLACDACCSYEPGVTQLGNFRPPAPQEWQMRASQLHQFAGPVRINNEPPSMGIAA